MGNSFMTSHKFEDFLTPIPLCHGKMTVFLRPSYIVTTVTTPSPPTYVTSFMDDPTIKTKNCPTLTRVEKAFIIKLEFSDFASRLLVLTPK